MKIILDHIYRNSLKNFSGLLIGLGVLALGCSSKSNIGTSLPEKVGRSPISLPDTGNGIMVAQTNNWPTTLRRNKVGNADHASGEKYGITYFDYSLNVPTQLKFDEINGTIVTPHGAIISFLVCKPTDNSKIEARRKSLEKALLSSTRAGSYVLKGPKFWGASTSASGMNMMVLTTDGFGVDVKGFIQFQSSNKESVNEAVTILNTCMQSIKVIEN